MSNEPAVETCDLRKRYGTTDALSGLTLVVPRGSICGLLGRNGSGKSTTLKMLMGMVKPSWGTGSVLGLRISNSHESVSIRQRTGFVSEDKLFPWSITVGELLRLTRDFYPGWRPDLEELNLRRFQLPLEASAVGLSKGMRCRLALLLALPRGADLLLLDEPTEGLDPAMAEETLQALVSLAAEQGTTILFSTHDLSNIEQIADRICIIEQGRVVLNDSLDELKANYRRVHLVFEREAPADAFVGARRDGRTLSLLVSRQVDEVIARAKSMDVRMVEVQPVTLKEIFLETSKGAKT